MKQVVIQEKFSKKFFMILNALFVVLEYSTNSTEHVTIPTNKFVCQMLSNHHARRCHYLFFLVKAIQFSKTKRYSKTKQNPFLCHRYNYFLLYYYLVHSFWYYACEWTATNVSNLWNLFEIFFARSVCMFVTHVFPLFFYSLIFWSSHSFICSFKSKSHSRLHSL